MPIIINEFIRIVPVLSFWVLAFLAPIMASIAPRGMVPLGLACCSVAVIFAVLGGVKRYPIHRGLFAAAMALIFYGALSSVWSISNDLSLGQSTENLYIFMAFVLAAPLLSDPMPRLHQTARNLLLGGFIIAFICIFIDLAFGRYIHLLIRGSHSPLEADLITLNRNLVALVALSWCAVSILWTRGLKKLSWLLALTMTCFSFFSLSQSAQLGSVIGCVVLGFSALWPHLGLHITRWSAWVGLLTMPLIAYFLWAHEIPYDGSIPLSFLQRLEVWHNSALLIAQHPWIGWGLDASRALPDNGIEHMHIWPSQTALPLHPHNSFLQIWIELGLFGVLICMAGLSCFLDYIRRLPAANMAPALACFCSCIAMSVTSYGIWQGWWMCTLLTTALLMKLVMGNKQ